MNEPGNRPTRSPCLDNPMQIQTKDGWSAASECGDRLPSIHRTNLSNAKKGKCCSGWWTSLKRASPWRIRWWSSWPVDHLPRSTGQNIHCPMWWAVLGSSCKCIFFLVDPNICRPWYKLELDDVESKYANFIVHIFAYFDPFLQKCIFLRFLHISCIFRQISNI